MSGERYALLRVGTFDVAIPAAPIAAVGAGAPPPGTPAVALGTLLAVSEPTGPRRFLRLVWSDGAALIITFAGGLRFGEVSAGAIRPLGPFLDALAGVFGARGIVATSDSAFAFLLEPRALLRFSAGDAGS